MVDRALGTEARGAGRLMPERPLPGADRSGQARIRRTEKRHGRHPDRGGDVRGPAVRADEARRAPTGGPPGAPAGPGRRGSGAAPEAAAWTRSASSRAAALPSSTVRIPRASSRDASAAIRSGGQSFAGPKRRAQLEADAWTAARQRRPRPEGAGPPTGARGRRPASARWRASLDAERLQQSPVGGHLVDRARRRAAARASGGDRAPRPRSPRASGPAPAGPRAPSRTSSAGSGRGRRPPAGGAGPGRAGRRRATAGRGAARSRARFSRMVRRPWTEAPELRGGQRRAERAEGGHRHHRVPQPVRQANQRPPDPVPGGIGRGFTGRRSARTPRRLVDAGRATPPATPRLRRPARGGCAPPTGAATPRVTRSLDAAPGPARPGGPRRTASFSVVTSRSRPPPGPAARPLRDRPAHRRDGQETPPGPARRRRARRGCPRDAQARRSPRRPDGPAPEIRRRTERTRPEVLEPVDRVVRGQMRHRPRMTADLGQEVARSRPPAPVRTIRWARASADGGSRRVPRGKRPPGPHGAWASRQTISTSFRAAAAGSRRRAAPRRDGGGPRPISPPRGDPRRRRRRHRAAAGPAGAARLLPARPKAAASRHPTRARPAHPASVRSRGSPP